MTMTFQLGRVRLASFLVREMAAHACSKFNSGPPDPRFSDVVSPWREEASSLIEAGGIVFDAPI
jgi:hypothetical protein